MFILYCIYGSEIYITIAKKKKHALKSLSQGTPAEQAATDAQREKSPNQDADAEKAFTNSGNNAEEALSKYVMKNPHYNSLKSNKLNLKVDHLKDNCAADKVIKSKKQIRFNFC